MTNPDELIVNNTGLIYMVLKEMRLTVQGEEIFEEAYYDGLLGLIRGSKLYDPSKGIKPDTFLVHCIRSGIHKGIKRRNYLYNKVNYLRSNLSLDLDYGDDSNDVIQLSNSIPDPGVNIEEEVFKKIDIQTLHYAIEHCLNEKEKFIMYHSSEIFGHKYMTFNEIGKVYNISRERINQIKKRAIKKLDIYMHKYNCYDWIKKESSNDETKNK